MQEIRIPAYWINNNKDSRMADIINKFIEQRPLTETEFLEIKGYMSQFLHNIYKTQRYFDCDNLYLKDLIGKIETINTNKKLHEFVKNDCRSLGIVPL